jgi:hypothetical protein
VKPHQEREEYIRKLQGEVNERDAVIRKLARELKTIETSLVEATFQVCSFYLVDLLRSLGQSF